jgi:apolipoprotein N-acyltransferase
MNILWGSLAGLLLALAFPKFSLWPLAFVALVPFYYALIKSKTTKAALAGGLFFGLVFFGFNLFWLTSLIRFVGGWAWVAWGCLAFFQTLFIVAFVLLWRITNYELRMTNFRPLIFSLLWVLFEWLRAFGPFGVPAGVVGYSQAPCLPLIQVASFAEVYGVSFLVVFFNVSLVEIFFEQRRWVCLIAAIFLIVASCLYGSSVLRSSVPGFLPKLALIQPNIDQMDKMNPGLVSQTYQIHETLTRRAAAAKPEIIIWPETAVFSYLLRDPVLAPRIRDLAIESGAWLVIGTCWSRSGNISLFAPGFIRS